MAPPRPPSFPIAAAPVVPGQPLGPVLLWPGVGPKPAWVIGRWTARQWCDDGGRLLAPTRWAPLPGAPPAMTIDHESAPKRRRGTGPSFVVVRSGLLD
jgi:hypothetical protein